ncbi:MAG: type III-B CRISPR module-associated Cmr3 family protein [Leptolyngbyaceae bacterium]|nr:type III-B CRISPR module-associated Cmr3 family protein [Leptolyngbyaceae bacterium]
MAAMFKYLVIVSPLGFLYGSAGAFLSPENLVGRSGAKFPPDAATLAGLFFSENKQNAIAPQATLRNELFVAGPFWAKQGNEENFYVPLPRHRIIEDGRDDEWKLNTKRQWERDANKQNIESEYRWQTIDSWTRPKTSDIRNNKEVSSAPWEYVSFLHPQMKTDERHVLAEKGLFLENAVQIDDDFCLVYLSTFPLNDGWYRFGGEGHFVEITCQSIEPESSIHELLKPDNKINHACALITPGVWGSNHLSHRYPKQPDFPKEGIKMLTDKAIPYRYRSRGKLGRGRYAVPPGTVYVFKKPLEKTWWEFPEEWFPKEGFPLKHLGCGLCLPVQINGAV